jgi:S1-C subfamily serine protease
MKRPSLYSRSPSSRAATAEGSPRARTAPVADAAPARTVGADLPGPPRAAALRGRLSPTAERALLAFIGAALAALLFIGLRSTAPAQRPITQKDIDKAVLHTLATKDIPSAQARAFEKVRPSVVMVRGVEPAKDGEPDIEEGVGTGVVIVDTGTILTNMHVALAAKQLKVEFHDGLVSDATIIGLQPEHDLAVLRSKLIPDDLKPATLRSTADLRPGDEVVAVGFPFGIGPSASAGVISGLRREFRSPKGERVLTNLIQFDAAANPGNSGGPLVTLDGEVVGIVTAILNPTEQRVFIGIGFAVPIENAASGVGMHPF